MSIQAEVSAPLLAAFGPPVWAYKPVRILGIQVAAAVMAAVLGLLLLALPVVAAFLIGGQLNATSLASNIQPSPSAYPVAVAVAVSPVTLPPAFTVRP